MHDTREGRHLPEPWRGCRGWLFLLGINVTILITTTENINGRKIEIVSHGIDSDTQEDVILPNETPQSMGAVRHPEYGWVLQ